jgi:hypothetical protein
VTSGIVLFAYNTAQINYIRLAILAASYIKRNMPGYPVCLITDNGTLSWYQTEHDKAEIDTVFDTVVIADPGPNDNQRVHYDSPWYKFTSDFRNGDKHRIFEYTPYDRTLLLDIDYIIHNDSLSYIFESDDTITMYHDAETLNGESVSHSLQYLNETGVPMVWSTVIYFDKTRELSKLFFDLWAHISDNYEFYQFLYGFDGTLYRTDFCVSIATHILNGMGKGSLIGKFPTAMINMSQLDEIVKIAAPEEWIYLVNDKTEHWKDTATKLSFENVHIMNKRSLERHYDTIMKELKLSRNSK